MTPRPAPRPALGLARLAPFALAVPLLTAAAAAPQMQTAVFAGGCFWTMEHKMEGVAGVASVVSGYTGGRTAKPSYQDVNTETTGHVEAVKVTFDPSKISYRKLVDSYWRMIDPTQADGQVCDIAPSYHPIVFVADPAQRREAEASKASIDTGKMKGRIVVPIRDAAAFWPAEGYHQDYATKNPGAYAAYANGCGRDRRLKELWGAR